jgi:hypothetical protein
MGLIEAAIRSELRVSPTAQVMVIDNTQAELVAAIANAVAGNGDVILCTRGGIEVTSTVAQAKSGVRIIAVDDGMSPLARGEFNAIYAAASFTDGPVMKVTAPCSIDGLGFASRDTGATFYSGAALLLGGDADANPYGVWLKNCRFPKWGLDNRIGLAIEGSSNCLVEHCDFEGVGTDFAAGIYVQGATQNLVVRYSHFRDCDYAILHGAFAGGGPNCMYGPKNVTQGLTTKFLSSGTATGMVFGNYFCTAPGAGTFNDTLANMETAGLMIAGNHYRAEGEGPT